MSNKNRTDDRRYAKRLLDYAIDGGTFTNHYGEIVSASACERERSGTPLNRSEEEFFALDPDYRREIVERVIESVDDLLENGFREYSLHTVFGNLRYKKDTGGDGMRVNDHFVPVLSRIFNENLKGIWQFKHRSSSNEVLPKTSTAEPEIAPYFFHVIEGGSAA